MNTEEKMNAYIRRTKVPKNDRYEMTHGNLRVVCDMACAGKVFDAVVLAFQFGQAKGYRMGRRADHD